MPELFNCYPPQIRSEYIEKHKGQTVILFPAAYFMKVPGSSSPLWVNVCLPDSRGYIGKTAPTKLLSNLVRYLNKISIEYEVYEI